MPAITSFKNARVKQIRALAQRGVREETGLFFVEGARSVREAIELHAPIELLVVAPELLSNSFAYETLECSPAHVPAIEVSAEVFRSISAAFSLKYGPQGLGAVVHQRWKPLAPHLCDHDGYWVALDAIQDPGNLGTILRTCDAAGAIGIMLIGHTTDPYDPAAVRASLGAIFSQRLVRTTFAELVAWKRWHHYMLIGTSGAASTDFRAATYSTPLVLLMGSERWGPSPERQSSCDAVVRIPMVGRGDSLNVAVATGVMLYEVERQLCAAR